LSDRPDGGYYYLYLKGAIGAGSLIGLNCSFRSEIL
jgi:hypothetical protein